MSKRRFQASVVGVVALALVVVGCETTGGSAGAGALVGGLAGAIIGNQSGHSTEGALIGAAVGAGIGLLAKHFKDVQARQRANVVMNQEQANANWSTTNQGRALPPVAQPEVLPSECGIAPGNTVAPGQDVSFNLAYRVVGQAPYQGTLARQDSLLYRQQGKANYEKVKDFSVMPDLATKGKNVHATSFTMPPQAPAGAYMLQSRVADGRNLNDVKFGHEYNFNVATKTADSSSESGARVLASNTP